MPGGARHLAERLRATTLFAGLDRAALQALVAAARVERLRRGRVLWREGDRPDAVAVVLAGRLDVVRHTREGERLFLRVLGADEVVGVSTVAGEAHSAELVAGADCELALLPGEALRRLLRERPDVGLRMVARLGDLLGRLTDELQALRSDPLDVRLRVLLSRLGHSRRELRFTHQELAEQVGATRPNVSRALGRLERAGAIRCGRGRIELLALALLCTITSTAACTNRVGYERWPVAGDPELSSADGASTSGDALGGDHGAGDALVPGDVAGDAPGGDPLVVPPTAIYRSVGPGRTSMLANGTGNALAVSGTTVTFADILPDDVGVGDVIEYDYDSSGVVNRLAFITGRTDALHYSVLDAGTAAPTPTVSPITRWKIYRAYTSLYDALRGAENVGIAAALRDFDPWTVDLIPDVVAANATWSIACYADGRDTVTSTTVPTTAGWTTDATRFLRIYAPRAATEVGVSQRHRGVFDRQKYHLYRDDGGDLLAVNGTAAIRIEGLQFWHDTVAVSARGVHFSNLPSGSQQWLSANIIRGNPGNADAVADAVYWESGTQVTARLWNNLVLGGWRGGLTVHAIGTGRLFVYNNTFVADNAVAGSYAAGWPVEVTVKNNVAASPGCYAGPFAPASTKNTCASNSTPFDLKEAAVVFADPASDRFELAGVDTVARGAGIDLSTDAELSFTDDITGAARVGAWSIGAFQSTAVTVPVAIYRSVGPGQTTALASSGATGIAVWPMLMRVESGPVLPANVGVGDALVYDASNLGTPDSIAFISRVLDAGKVYELATASGQGTTSAYLPTSWAIYRAYTALHAAVGSWGNGDPNAGMPVALQGFDSLGFGKDLVTPNLAWNIACYADGVDDISASQVMIDNAGWLTGPANGLRIFTPHEPQQVGVSQRHGGVLDPTGYTVYNTAVSVSALITVDAAHVWFDGLQIVDDSSSGNNVGIELYPDDGGLARVSNSIIHGNAATSGAVRGIAITGDSTGVVQLWNNVLYDLSDVGVLDNGNTGTAGLVVVANNTFYNCDTAVATKARPVIATNNLAQAIVTRCFEGTPWGAVEDYNRCNLVEPVTGLHSSSGNTAIFVNAGARNLRLDPSDTVATDVGLDMSRHPTLPFDDNVAGELRVVPWNIGAF